MVAATSSWLLGGVATLTTGFAVGAAALLVAELRRRRKAIMAAGACAEAFSRLRVVPVDDQADEISEEQRQKYAREFLIDRLGEADNLIEHLTHGEPDTINLYLDKATELTASLDVLASHFQVARSMLLELPVDAARLLPLEGLVVTVLRLYRANDTLHLLLDRWRRLAQ